ncbi:MULTISPECIES: hypothetical protein [unclassified Lysobacter]|uniref:hypothetical protein n=1 Tax=unclassified Lysobacter TaxID=2635362 RepID=UPI0006F8DC04|nr:MULTISPECIES: hypothetical protein [unclassified Lysobacter]KQZ56315.1 hypothetical protein ASD53_12210 [Lysobacter sp. Root559]KRC35247.1 hypothetical protein ASE10_11370 [Lysobacter sp. Root76]KRD70937.1 hypothetical protein ASE45_03535 [Lysobacter sp. Root96]
MSNALRFSLLVLGLLAGAAQAADPIEDRQRAALAGRYVLEGAADAASELLLEPDGRFEWSLSYGLMVESASGRWNVGGDRVVLTTQAPVPSKPAFSLDQTLPWNPDAQKRLGEFAEERREALIEEACGFVKTYRLGLELGELAAIADVSAATDAARRGEAEAALAPALAALEQARRALETAGGAAIEARAAQPERRPPPLLSAAEAAAAAATAAATEAALQGQTPADAVPVDEMEAAERAAQTYLQRLHEVWRLHAMADRRTPELRPATFDSGRCLPPSEADAQGEGYAVVIGDPQRGQRAEGIGVGFVYSDGRTERTETGPSGWALAVRRPGARLQQVILQAPDIPAQALALDESRGRIFAIGLDSAAAMPVPFDQIILSQDDGALIAPRVPGRYVRH